MAFYMLDALEKQIVYVKHLKKTNELTGVKRVIVYYIYAQLLDGIREKRFRVSRYYDTQTARIDFFSIQVRKDLMYVDTIYRSSKRIRAFKFEEEDRECLIKAIESAVKLVGLEFEEVKDFSAYKNFKVYLTNEEGVT